MYITPESLCCILELKIVLYINYNLKINKKRRVWVGDTNLGIFRIYLVFKATRMDEITIGVSVARKPQG